MCVSEKEIATYNTLNRLSRRDSVVILGSTYFREMPVGELKQAFGILSDIYNRSLTDLSVFEAKDIAIDIVNEMSPRKLILQLGETDLRSGKHTVDEVIDQIEAIVRELRKVGRSVQIVLVSLNNIPDRTIEEEFNRKLEKLSRRCKALYADISSDEQDDKCHIQAFRMLRFFMSDDRLLQIL
ncbi:hypothetical protein SAMN06296952_0026 [Oscillospiraceae bacterium]|nr:hypothetical protein SAMN06296952_0026 [Oscillospiraceae bacterium]